MAKKTPQMDTIQKLAQPNGTVQTKDAHTALADELDSLLISCMRIYRNGINAHSITPGDIKSPVIGQVRNRIKDLWAMSEAAKKSGDDDTASDLESRAARFTAKLPFESDSTDGEETEE